MPQTVRDNLTPTFAAISLGSYIGVLLRVALLALFVNSPITTIILPNLLGGVLTGWTVAARRVLQHSYVPLVGFLSVGVCGSLTSFSAWQLAAFAQLSVSARHNSMDATASWIAIIAVGLAAPMAGFSFGKHLFELGIGQHSLPTIFSNMCSDHQHHENSITTEFKHNRLGQNITASSHRFSSPAVLPRQFDNVTPKHGVEDSTSVGAVSQINLASDASDQVKISTSNEQSDVIKKEHARVSLPLQTNQPEPDIIKKEHLRLSLPIHMNQPGPLSPTQIEVTTLRSRPFHPVVVELNIDTFTMYVTDEMPSSVMLN